MRAYADDGIGGYIWWLQDFGSCCMVEDELGITVCRYTNMTRLTVMY